MARLTKVGYLKHLIKIRKNLVHFVELVKRGEEDYLIDIAQKLRILYIRKSRTDPLIVRICDFFSLRISVYVFLSLQEQVDRGLVLPTATEALVVEIVNNPVFWFDRGHELVEILDALGKPGQISIGKNKYSIKDIIEVYADKMGGAHIDEYVDDSDLASHDQDFLIGGATVANRIIYDTARHTVQLIDMIMNCINNGEENIFVKHI